MEQIKDLKEAYMYLNDHQVLVSRFSKKTSFFRLKKDAIMVLKDNLSCYLSFKEFEDLFANNPFYLYKDDKEEFVSLEKDKEYYSFQHK